MGDFHVMGVFEVAISGDIVNDLNFFDGFKLRRLLVAVVVVLQGEFGSVRAGLSSSSGSNVHVVVLSFYVVEVREVK